MTVPVERLTAALSDRYLLERELGAGGMATVYLAQDLKHDRKVAIKVLRPDLGAMLGAERFLTEIKTTAKLQHPNILALLDSGEADGLLFYVMPLIDGESLRARLERERQLPVDDALRIVTEVAGALDYAHRHGVIHRDIKPENILLHDGRAVVADFGIALAVQTAGGQRMPQTGLSLGTPQYMSPEQAMGERQIDARSDVYALGAVLYELLTGEPPFSGATAQSIVAKVLTERPASPTVARDTIPMHVEAALFKALAKLPADRFTTAAQFAEALANTSFFTATAETSSVAPARRPGRGVLPWALAVAALAAAVWGWLRPAAPPVQHARFALVFGDSARLRTDRIGMNVSVSNDGSRIAWLGGDPSPRIFVRTLDDVTPQPVPGSDNAMNPQFSPDGLAIAFIVAGQLKRVSLSGGPIATIADEVVNYSWGENNVVVFSRIPGANAGLWRVGSSGGAPERLTTPDTARREARHVWPYVLPGGKAAVFAIRTSGAGSEHDSLAVVEFAGGAVTRLGLRGSNPRYAPTGHLLFSRSDGSVRGIRFSPGNLKLTEPEVPLLSNLAVLPASNVGQGGAMTLAFGANGTMVYQPGTPLGQLVKVDRSGGLTLVRPDTQQYVDPRVSPDGKRIAMTIVAPNGSNDIWIHPLGGTSSRFTNDGASDLAAWTPDGRRLAWRARSGGPGRSTAQWAPWDGSGGPETAFTGGAGIAWLPSGRGGFTITTGAATSANLERVSLDAIPGTLTPFLNTPSTETAANVSPDGGWLAFVSNQTGREEVYVCSTSDPANLHQVSTHGGAEPVWGPSGRELFYRDGHKIIAAHLETKPGFVLARRDTVMTDIYQVGANYAAYDVMPDGRSFIMIRPIGAGAAPMIVLNWFDELRKRMAQASKK